MNDVYDQPWWVYIVECKDGTYYTGISNDINKRIDKHNSGDGAVYTKFREPVELVYFEEHLNHHEAASREYKIKQLKRKEKEKLIKNFFKNKK